MASSTCYATIPAMSCRGQSTITRFGPNNLFLGKQSYELPLMRRNAKFTVRSMREDNEKEEQQQQKQQQTHDGGPDLTPNRTEVTTKRTVDLFSFDGLAPERINGRSAMIGFVAAVGVELATGRDVFSQVFNGGVMWFLLTSAVLVLATLIPIYRGLSPEAKNNGFWNSDAEIWNGRFAMIGLVALAFTEYVKGGPLINV
uniref:Desiccation stress protein DSP-22, chloroplastic n=1 Tax=Craterostigma plantagineum TaxID=4153 RepID=DS22_CRAPL|nr:RecName: Full=Desiccation stress protein DSP-22, chloroplastic; Flags: Precursor [Craterostigma plantagineum]CAA47164.1 dsp-22 [Craterostigma plantagineum]